MKSPDKERSMMLFEALCDSKSLYATVKHHVADINPGPLYPRVEHLIQNPSWYTTEPPKTHDQKCVEFVALIDENPVLHYRKNGRDDKASQWIDEKFLTIDNYHEFERV